MRKIVLLMTLVFLLLMPHYASAHAVLLESAPSPDSRFEQSPGQLSLTFNERLENGLFYIRVYDDSGRSVTRKSAELSRDQQALTLMLPNLLEGSYTVSYRALSADGHPISASYVFHVGTTPASGPQEHMPIVEDDQHRHDTDERDVRAMLIHLVKAVYMTTMLFFAGMLMWRALKPGSVTASDRSIFWLHVTQRIFLLALVAWIGLQLAPLMEAWSHDEFVSLLNTSLGRLWLVQLVTMLISWMLIGKHRFIEVVLAFALLAAKATSGHAAASDPVAITLTMDFIHLVAASLWLGGLLIIVTNWWRNRPQAFAFIPTFSMFAWLSIAVLVATGAIMTLLLLPGISYLAYSDWGTLLLTKVSVVVIVIVVASWIRWKWKRHPNGPGGTALVIDLSLAVIITALAAVLSGLNPVPANAPLHWHEMGDEIHMTAQIAPNAPGINHFAVKIWLPEGAGEPKSVQLQLVPIKYEEGQGAIDIPLSPAEDTAEKDFFLGFDRYDYAADGIYLTFPGKWKVVVQVMTADDDPYVYSKEMRIY